MQKKKKRKKRSPQVVNVRYDNSHDVVYVGRPTPFGNPFIIGVDGTRKEVIRKFKKYLRKKPKLVERAKKELKGHVLGCHCAPLPCHADIWLEIVNAK
jgi:hypothetical protein